MIAKCVLDVSPALIAEIQEEVILAKR